MVVDVHEAHEAEHAAAHGPPPPRKGLRRLTGPGWLRVLWCMPLGWVLATLLVVGARAALGYEPLWEFQVLIVAWTVIVPLAFLAGLGGFDYWLYWISGRPTRPEDHSGHGARTWKDYFRVNTDHKVIGVQYVVTTIFFFVAAGLMAMFMRAELAQPGMQYVDTNTFNGLFSVHASLMIFLFIIPAFAGLGNYVIPLMIGAPDMAFPRLNALSFWLLPIAGLIMISSYLVPDGGAFAAGWTNYVPLAVNQADGNLMFQMGVQWAGASSIMTALNFLVTIITMRAPGMSFWRMPLLVWANFATSTLVVLATPFVAGSQFFIMFDRVLHTNFFNPELGGDIVAYQHIFWFYSHPAVYIMMLPGFGIASEVISVFARKPIFGYRLMALSLMAILILGFSVWAHHMFVSGMQPWIRIPMMVTTLLIAVPTGIKVFSWLATLWEGRIHFKTPMLFALGLRLDVRDRRPVRDLPRLRADRHPRERHVLRRRPHPLRPLRRVALHDLRRHLLLVPEDDRADVQRAAREDPLLADVRRLQRHLLPDALDRPAGDAAARRRLRARVRELELRHLDRVVRPRAPRRSSSSTT